MTEKIQRVGEDQLPAQRLIRETHIARRLRTPYENVTSEVGYIEREGGGEVISFDLTDGGRKFRVFIVEVGNADAG